MVIKVLFRRYVVMASAAALWVGGAGCSSDSTTNDQAAPPKTLLQIKTLSNRADLINGGDALVEIVLPPGITPAGLHVAVGTRDVSAEFAMRPNGRTIGAISGLADGPNLVTADVAGDHGASLTITNHKIGGPVFTGAQVKPFVCATPDGAVDPVTTAQTTLSGLSTRAIDDQCNIATEVKLFYRSNISGCVNVEPDPNPPALPNANACFKPYNPAAPPSDLAMTTTDAGVTVPYIVRDERGTLNRGIYDIVVLFDPAADDVKTGWKPYAPQRGWNGKVVYSFGASSGQPRLQFRSEQHWNNEDFPLSKGFLVAFNSMTDSLFNSNRTLMTETLMMMKEKIIDSFGEATYVMGDGCSGGSINQLTAASIFPGLLDGIQPTCTFPDSETTGIEVADCLQLVHAYSSTAWLTLMTTQGANQSEINAKKTAINGHLDQNGCHAWVLSFANIGKPGQYTPFAIDPATGVLVPGTGTRNNCGLPSSLVYDPATNPTGVRCTGPDHAVAIFGKVTDGSRARTTTDNVGVQYGLKALTAGTITPEEFVTVNEQAGGVDGDDNFATARTPADPDALATAYRAGIVSDAKHLATTAIIDLRGWDDQGIHHQWRSFGLRARLDAVNGNHKNHVMWRYGTGLLAPAASGLTQQSFLMMDQWLTAMKADIGATTTEAKVAARKPTDAVDFCYLSTDTTFTTKVTDFAMCDADARLKPHSSPRQVAGGPLAENILKCQLKPINPADYAPAVLTDAQRARLAVVFPTGVCDFSKPGVGQQPAVSPLDFSAGPGGVELPTPPGTKAL